MPRRHTAALPAAVLLVGALSVAAVAPDPAAPVETTGTVVDAGSLRAEITSTPWSIAFTDARGEGVLTAHDGTGPGPIGSLGFHIGGQDALLREVSPAKPQDPDAPGRRLGWAHATEVLEGDRDGAAYVALLATTDPTRRVSVEIAPAGDGIIEVSAEVVGDLRPVSAMQMSFQAEPGERFGGFGERSNAVEQRGRTIEHYVGEGPFQTYEYPFIDAIMPLWGIRWREDATYFPIPWLLSSEGYGVLLDDDEPSYHRLASDDEDAWNVEVESTSIRLRVFAGPEPADALARFTEVVGRQPPGEPWFFGPWVQPRRGEEVATITELQEADAPVSVAATFLHYLPCGDHQGRRGAERELTSGIHERGLAILTYVNPLLCVEYREVFERAAEAGALQKRADGSPYTYQAYINRTPPFTEMAQFDFTAPAGRSLYDELLTEAVDDGHDGWMEDFGEYTPLDAHGHDGSYGWSWHNRYPTDFHCAAQDFADRQDRPLARYVRSGWTGTAACAPIVWGGDPTTSWGFDGLTSAVFNGLSLGTSGVSTWGSDIGGFFALGHQQLTPELLIRWIQFGAASPVMRTQAEGVAIPDKDRPQVWDADILPHWRRWAKLHTQLNPYLLAATTEYERTGMPVMRHHLLTHPDDPDATDRDDQYLFGPDLLVAPVLAPDVTRRELYLPDGGWIDLWRSAAYVETTGGLDVTGTAVLTGPGAVTVPAPLDELPVLVRAGAVLPLLPPDVDTLSDNAAPAGVVRRADRLDELHLLAFPAGTRRSAIDVDEGVTSTIDAGRWRLAFDGGRERTYTLQAGLGAAGLGGPPCVVELDGQPVSSWELDADGEVLRAVFTTTDGTLEVRVCPTATDQVPVERVPTTATAAPEEPAGPLPVTGGGTTLGAGALLLGLFVLRLRRAGSSPWRVRRPDRPRR